MGSGRRGAVAAAAAERNNRIIESSGGCGASERRLSVLVSWSVRTSDREPRTHNANTDRKARVKMPAADCCCAKSAHGNAACIS